MKKLQELLEDDYEDFESLENVEKSSYVLGSELWESKFDGLLALVKEYIVDVWEIQKHKLYDGDSGSGLQSHNQSSPGERSIYVHIANTYGHELCGHAYADT